MIQDHKERGEDWNYLVEEPFVGDVHLAPSWMIDNELITRGHRVGYNTPWKLFKSFFVLHNESVNVWSHCTGVLFFIGLIIYTGIYLAPPTSASDNLFHRWAGPSYT
jgi:hypothetical protein